MDSNSYKTVALNKPMAERNWLLVDADSQPLGRIASEIAKRIRGKHKPSFTPNVNCGDHVIVINSDKVKLSGNKWTDKKYVRHTGYPGGQRIETPKQVREKSSAILVERAVKGMLPKNRLGRQLFKNMHVFNGSEHPYVAQKPKKIKL